MDTSTLLIGAVIVFIAVVMFIVVYGGPSTTPIAVPTITPPVLQADTKDCGCPKRDRCRDDCPKRRPRKEHKEDCGCDPCRKRRRHSDPDGPYYAHGGRDDDSGLLYGTMDGFQNGVLESTAAPFTIGTPA